MKTFVFDMDGVIWRGRDAIPHAAETIAALKERGHTLFYYTNNSRLKRTVYVELLRACGIEATVDQILTSGYAVRVHLENIGALGKSCFAIGGDGLVEELEGAGLSVDTDPGVPSPGVGSKTGLAQMIQATRPPRKYDYVVVGLDKEFTYAKLAMAQAAILDGAEFMASNLDATFPAENGRLMPGCGALVAAIRETVGKEAQFYGKPKTFLLEALLERKGINKEDVIIVGDRLDSDILMSNLGGFTSALVMTGVTTREELDNAPPEMRPTHVFETLGPAFVEAMG